MPKLFRKIVLLMLIIGLNWAGLSAIGGTFAFFSNAENSSANTFQAGILDLSLRSGQNNFVPASIASNMAPGDSVARDIYVGKTANSSSLKHRVSYEFVSGNHDFCNQLQLKIWYNHYHGPTSEGYTNRDMRLKYNGPLISLANLIDVDFIISHPDDQFDTNPSDGTEQWFFYQITFPTGGSETVDQKCNFNFVFEAWQDNIENYGDGGFTDKEEIYSALIDSVFIEELTELEGNDGLNLQNNLENEENSEENNEISEEPEEEPEENVENINNEIIEIEQEPIEDSSDEELNSADIEEGVEEDEPENVNEEDVFEGINNEVEGIIENIIGVEEENSEEEVIEEEINNEEISDIEEVVEENIIQEEPAVEEAVEEVVEEEEPAENPEDIQAGEEQAAIEPEEIIIEENESNE